MKPCAHHTVAVVAAALAICGRAKAPAAASASEPRSTDRRVGVVMLLSFLFGPGAFVFPAAPGRLPGAAAGDTCAPRRPADRGSRRRVPPPDQLCTIGYWAKISSVRLKALSTAACGVMPLRITSIPARAKTCSLLTWARAGLYTS